MFSSYRLGDLVLVILNEEEQNAILKEHPNSIGHDYILDKKIYHWVDEMTIITNIVIRHLEKNMHLLPADIENSTVLHLRLGDVVRGDHWYEKIRRPFDISYLQEIVPTNNKIYVIGQYFYSKPSSTNYAEGNYYSKNYLDKVLNTFNAEHFYGGHADIDFCLAVKSKIFVQGRGFYSKLIVKVRKRLNLESIEVETHDGEIK
jgi:hypothetical protein